ncbi:MAG: hypothetical protein ACHQLQ_09355 [Candidatus Acidiferrales bacterium]
MPSIIDEIKHSRWAMLVPLALVFLGTFQGQLVRGLCLIAAVGVSIWILRDTELVKGNPEHSPKKRNRRTLVACLVLALVAALLFLGSNRLDQWAVASKIEKPKPDSSQVAITQQAISSPPANAPAVKPPAKPLKKHSSEPAPPQPTYSATNPTGSIINQGSTVDAQQTVNNFGPPPPVFALKLLKENVKLSENLYRTEYQLNVETKTAFPSLHVRAEGTGLGSGDITPCLEVNRVVAGGATGHLRDSTSGYGFCDTHAQDIRSGQYLIEVISATPTTVHLTYEPD